jgi:membrane protein required for colicin V production
VTFAVVIVLVVLLGKFLTSVVKTVGLSIFNRLAGFAFGAAQGILIASFLLMLIARIDHGENLLSAKSKNDSKLYYPISVVAPAVVPLVKKYSDDFSKILKNEEPKDTTTQQ